MRSPNTDPGSIQPIREQHIRQRNGSRIKRGILALFIGDSRPCLIVSPDEMNAWLRTVLVAPMTTAQRTWPSRVAIRFDKKDGQVALDQLRCIDKNRLVKKLGKASRATVGNVSDTLVEMFTR